MLTAKLNSEEDLSVSAEFHTPMRLPETIRYLIGIATTADACASVFDSTNKLLFRAVRPEPGAPFKPVTRFNHIKFAVAADLRAQGHCEAAGGNLEAKNT